MNGADHIVSQMFDGGIDTIFLNPGTSEMQLVHAIDGFHEIRPILGLFEGVCTGAADGFSRIAGRPAATLLHLGPGLANGLANLHNARRAGSSVLNIVGDHARDHRKLDAPLTSDIEGLARPMSNHVSTLSEPGRLSGEIAAAIDAAEGGIATLIVPADIAWSAVESRPAESRHGSPKAAERGPDKLQLRRALDALRTRSQRTMILVGGALLTGESLNKIEYLMHATGCQAMIPTFNSRLERGAGRPELPRIPYYSEDAVVAFEAIDVLVCLDAQDPVAFFAYPGKQSRPTAPGTQVIDLNQAPLAALDEILAASYLDAPPQPARDVHSDPAESLNLGEPLNADNVARLIAAHLPHDAIIVDEAVTARAPLIEHTRDAAQHDWLDLTGGSIGQCLPVATGAAVAAPDRKVLAVSGDGSALYTIQALWTQARENLNVTTLIYNNASYDVLKVEMMRTGITSISERAAAMLSIDSPRTNFCMLANSFGVRSSRVSSVAELDAALRDSMRGDGPDLIEIMIVSLGG